MQFTVEYKQKKKKGISKKAVLDEIGIVLDNSKNWQGGRKKLVNKEV